MDNLLENNSDVGLGKAIKFESLVVHKIIVKAFSRLDSQLIYFL